MNNIKDADFLKTFPPALRQDEKFLTLGKLIADELHITANEIKKNIIYADIDSLDEKWLDVLAYDLHVDWYDYDYDVDIKRKLIKNSIRVHQKLGTRYAVQSVLQDVYRTAEIQEWFEYGGQPYTFKITVDVGSEGISEDTAKEIERKMYFYKNLRSHCDGIFYEVSIEKATVKAVAFEGVGAKLKVKPLLKDNIRAAGQNDIRAATYIGVKIAVTPLLAEEIVQSGETTAIARLQALNSLKVKSYTTSELKADMTALGYLKAYHRNKQSITIRKEQ